MTALANLLIAAAMVLLLSFTVSLALIGFIDVYHACKAVKRNRKTSDKKQPVGRRSRITALFQRR